MTTTKVKNLVSLSFDGKPVLKKIQTFDVKEKKDYKKINKRRRSRGYNFEYSIVNAFNDHHSKQWNARRLGGSSTGLPDIVATNKAKSLLYAIEAKSGESDILYIPRDQIERCLDITDKFLTAYKNRYIVFAFKFKGKKGGRKLQYRFILMSIHLGGLPEHLKGVSYNIRTETLNTHESYEDYPICLPTFGKTLSITEFVNQI
jgi:Holliday junction resolvase